MSDFCVFTTNSGAQYLYDTPTNSVHPWPQPLDELWAQQVYSSSDEELDTMAASPSPVTAATLRYIRLWRRNTAAFRASRSRPRYPLFSYDQIPRRQYGQQWAMDLVLIVSEDCNLRCDYCTNSGFYPALRKHRHRLMSWRVAKKAIDLWFGIHDEPRRRAYSDKRLNLCFYGGEPLLNRDVVYRGVEYARASTRAPGELAISISTNLTLLHDEDLSFLKDQDLFLSVSLDGPRVEHDRHRRFVGGTPTFDVVCGVLKKIRDFDRDYYDTRVRVQPTINGNSNIPAIQQFFELEGDPSLRLQLVSFLRDMETCDFHKAYLYDPLQYKRRMLEVADDYFARKVKGETFAKGDFLYALFDEGLQTVFERLQHRSTSSGIYTPTCVPGRKLAVFPDGTIHMCERISQDFPFGNVDSGLDEKAMVDLINRFGASLPNCDECWLRSLCSLCMAATGENKDFRFGARCEVERSGMAELMRFLYGILERRPHAFVPPELDPKLGSFAETGLPR